MEITKQLEAEITRFMDNYWSTYFAGDLETWSTYLTDDYKNIGGTEEEIWNSKKEILDYTKRVMDQMMGTAQLRNKQTRVFSLEPFVLAHEFIDIYIKIKNEWTFYGKFRLSTIIQKNKDSWQVIHQHGSYPDSKTDQGEAFAFDKISTENRELKEAIKRRTIELESKNRELQIEASLEKVRAVAMGMRNPDEILDICKGIFTELQLLGFTELRNSLINFWDDESQALIDYDYSDYSGGHKSNLSYNSHPVFDQFQKKIRQSNDSFAELIVEEDLLESWKQRRRDSGEYEDPRLENINALYYYFYSIGVGAVGISTFTSLTTEKLNILKRFRNVFDLAHRRYQDIEKAEAQAREAKIEVALERVRSRAMAMRKTDELLEAAELVSKELSDLGIESMNVSYAFVDKEEKYGSYYSLNPVDGKIPPFPFVFPHTETEVMRSILSSWKKQEPFNVIELDEEATLKHQTYIGEHILYLIRKNKIDIPFTVEAFLAVSPKKAVLHTFNFTNGYLFNIGGVRLTTKQEEMLLRFTKVFEHTYTRFLDLQKAEAQAREAQIELGLERVRARAMAMQNSDELAELVGAVFTELTHLGFTLTSCIIWIHDPEHSRNTLWIASAEMNKPAEPFYVQPFHSDFFRSVMHAWKANDPKWVFPLTGTEKRNFEDAFFNELPNLPDALKNALKNPKQVVFSASFNNFGALEIVETEALTDEKFEILHRFGKVFDSSFTRFNDLKKAEAQAREAQIELGLERVRAKAMAMQKSEELGGLVDTVFNELKKLHFLLDRCLIMIYDPETNGSTWWLANPEPEKVPVGIRVKYHEYLPYLSYIKAWKDKLVKWQYLLQGTQKKEWDEFIFSETEMSLLPQPVIAGMKSVERIFLNVSFNNFGSLTASSFEPLPEEQFDILLRFAKVFDLTYTRFNDLQKAEAQAREAQIELGLERVRARAMAMQKSGELSELVDTVFKELTKLDFALSWCMINIIDEPSMSNTVWGANPEIGKAPESYHMLFEDYRFHHEMFKAWKEKQSKWTIVLKGKEKEIYDEYLFNKTEFRRVPEHVQKQMRATKKYEGAFTFSNFGGLQTIGEEPLSEANMDILARFGKVFDLTYTRFNDLKLAEAQAREAKIEAALEKVRSRTMAMQNSSELPDAANILFLEVQKLGIPTWSCGYNVLAKDKRSAMCWMSSEGILQQPFTLRLWGEASFDEMGDFILSDKMILIQELAGKAIDDHYNYMKSFPDLKATFDHIETKGLSLPTYQVNHLCKYTHGFLLFITYEHVPDAHDIFKRFTKVFEQTYTRFLDLQKAEAQTREAKIEMALEKVRARTMGMQKSGELADVAKVLFTELNVLVHNLWTCGFVLCEKDRREDEWWLSMDDGFTRGFFLPNVDDFAHSTLYEGWLRGEAFRAVQLDGNELQEHYDWLMKVPVARSIFEEMDAAGLARPDWQKLHAAYFSKGYLVIITREPCAGEEIFKRFAQVFDLTYTRFLDLQKAEAQARESKIEAALEKVRSRSLAMHKSDELQEVVHTVFEKLDELNVDLYTAIIFIFTEGSNDIVWWLANKVNQQYSRILVPYTDNIYLKDIFEAKEDGKDFFSGTYSMEDKNELFHHLFEHTDFKYVPETQKKFLLESKLATMSVALAKNTGINITSYTRESFSAKENEILKRFAKVFEQAYTRFLDLQKAEEQTREAQIEAALERVRSRTMAMQKSNELQDAALLLVQQVKILGVPSFACGYNIWDDDRKAATAWMAGEDRLQPPFKTSSSEDVFFYIHKAAQSGEQLFIAEQGGKELETHYNYMATIPEFRDVMENMAKAGLSVPTFQIIHCAFFSQGYLMFISFEPVPEAHDIFKRFAKVFEQTYTRFLDLQKAEAQAIEAIKRASVDRIRAEIASMRTTGDLERIQPLIWNELKILGVPFIRCGVFIMDETEKEVNTLLSTPDGKAIAAFRQSYNAPGEIKAIVDSWHKKEIYKQHWDEEQFLSFANDLVQQGAVKSGEKYLTENRPTDLHLHFLPFLQGMLYVGNTTALSDDELKLVQNLGEAFSTAYARYEDFNKLEAAKKQVDNTLNELQLTQKQLIQSEKMASLGELTAGIAHEIQNPLNFVNNFSDVSKELLAEMKEALEKGNTDEATEIMKDVIQNLEKINHHGKRADGIVKGMLQHSRSSSGQKEPTNINVLADEYLRLAYHGLRAKDKSFNASIKTDYDESIGYINIIPQDIGRVILNLISNAFYAVNEKNLSEGQVAIGNLAAVKYEPTVSISTKRTADQVQIIVGDNGNGISQKLLDKIFQPFFTTKPTGQGTGLGLSLSYDIVKAHGGDLNVVTKEGIGSEFIIQLRTL